MTKIGRPTQPRAYDGPQIRTRIRCAEWTLHENLARSTRASIDEIQPGSIPTCACGLEMTMVPALVTVPCPDRRSASLRKTEYSAPSPAWTGKLTSTPHATGL